MSSGVGSIRATSKGRTRAVSLALVMAMVLAACGGGDSSTETADGDTSTTATTDVGDAGDAGGDDTSADPADPADPATSGPAAGGEGDPAAPSDQTDPAASGGGDGQPAPAGNGAPAPAPAAAAGPVDDAAALSRALRVEDMPAGYQKQDETTGEDEDQDDFEESFVRCMKAAGADPNALADPAGEASRTFGKGSANPQNPEGISSGVAGFTDGAAPERMVVELGKLFNSEPGRVCIEEEIEKAIASEAGAAAPPGATFEVDAQQLDAYKAAGGIAQLRMVITVNFGAQTLVFVSDLAVVRAGNFASILSFTQSNEAFDTKVAQGLIDKAVARLAS